MKSGCGNASRYYLDKWYNLLRETQGSLNCYKENKINHMIDNQNFLKSEVCNYGYIINLDTNKLEFWSNDIHLKADIFYYKRKYKCLLTLEFNLNTINHNNIDSILSNMNNF